MSFFAIAAGLSAISGMMSYSSALTQYKNNKKIQEYRNKMANIANANNQNAITSNVLQAQTQSATQSLRIQQQGAALAGQVSTQAAATGTVGNSVSMAQLAAKQQEAAAELNREDQLESTYTAALHQRQQSAQQAAGAQDYTAYEQPSAAGYLLNSMAGIGMQYLASGQGGDTRTPTDAKQFGTSSSFLSGAVSSGFSSLSRIGFTRAV